MARGATLSATYEKKMTWLGSISTAGGGRTATCAGATDAFVGGATPSQLFLMLSLVASR